MHTRGLSIVSMNLTLVLGVLVNPVFATGGLVFNPLGDDGGREAAAFLETLGPAERTQAVRPINDPERFQWTYLPGIRAGIRLGDLNQEQARAFNVFLSKTLSDAGFRRIEQLRAIEPVENRGGAVRTGPDDYWVRFYGDPSQSAEDGISSVWAWRLEGHHLVLNAAVVDGEVVCISPLFLGASPHRGNERSPESVRGVEPLRGEDELAAGLMATLGPLQKSQARSFDPPPRDIRSGTGKIPSELAPEGLRISQMNESQRGVIDAIVGSYLGIWPKSARSKIWDAYQTSDPSEVRFLWRGREDRAAPHYWRISGPSLVIEYWNAQNSADHVHVVLRTRHGEFVLE